MPRRRYTASFGHTVVNRTSDTKVYRFASWDSHDVVRFHETCEAADRAAGKTGRVSGRPIIVRRVARSRVWLSYISATGEVREGSVLVRDFHRLHTVKS